jgi:methionine sulfoxide reductase catalytic subunit
MGWVMLGAVYVILLFASGEWRRLVPTSWSVIPGALGAINEYGHLRLAQPAPSMPYNPLQQLVYFAVVFLLAPLQIATGAAMSPAVAARFPWYARIFGSRQAARTIHFAGLVMFVAFVIVHTAMVVAHGIPREFGAIALAGDRSHPLLAVVVGLVGLVVVVVINVAANVIGRRNPRQTQVMLGGAVGALQGAISACLVSRQHYQLNQVSAYFWVNGLPPPDAHYSKLASNGFHDWRLKVTGAVESDLEMSLADLRRMPATSQVTKHNCIQGWTGVGQWGGVALPGFVERCHVLSSARYVVFYAFDDKALTQTDAEGFYYETLDLDLARKPQTILAYEFNGAPLPIEHGAPLRLRVESQLGFKMVKWIREISFVADYRDIGLGYGGWREDHSYYGRVVGI